MDSLVGVHVRVGVKGDNNVVLSSLLGGEEMDHISLVIARNFVDVFDSVDQRNREGVLGSIIFDGGVADGGDRNVFCGFEDVDMAVSKAGLGFF